MKLLTGPLINGITHIYIQTHNVFEVNDVTVEFLMFFCSSTRTALSVPLKLANTGPPCDTTLVAKVLMENLELAKPSRCSIRQRRQYS